MAMSPLHAQPATATRTAPISSRPALRAFIDSLAQATIDSGKVAGMTIAVVQGRDTIAIKGYGKANLELNVPMKADAIFEIGSLTKQFTGAAVMQLAEQGKLQLDDDITRYLSFNTGGRKVTLRRLLDHTSGVPNYTDWKEFTSFAPLELPRDTLLRMMEARPFDFEPGTRSKYNNSAFFIMGLVIEKVSGQPYGEYVKQHLFTPAGMVSAHYCSERDVFPGKTSGYEWGGKALVQHSPLRHTWPYAAGSLCANAVDMVKWNETLHRTTRLMSAATYQDMMTPDTLNDGKRITYAKGLGQSVMFGHRVYTHSGGIFGWTTHGLYFPDNALSVIVFFNTSGLVPPGSLATRIAEAVLGPKPAAPAK
jgi:CubicO group peptidase (beta-lactamase class C family)